MKNIIRNKGVKTTLFLISFSFLFGCSARRPGSDNMMRMEIENLKKDVSEIKQVTSDLEAQQASMNTILDLLDKKVNGADRRININNGVSGTLTGFKSESKNKNVEEGFLEELDSMPAALLYKKGYNYVISGNYYKGITVFKYFLDKYPENRFADNAHYWSGECYYAVKDYQNALTEFQDAAKMNGNKVQDALLKVGYTQSILGDNESALETLNQVVERFPGTRVARLAKHKLSKLQ